MHCQHPWDRQFSGLLNNIHTAKDGDFTQAEKITHTGALLVALCVRLDVSEAQKILW